MMMAAGVVPVPVPTMRGRASLRIHPSSINAAPSSSLSEFRLFCKGHMAITDAAADDEDHSPGGVPVLAVAVCGSQGKVVLIGHKPVLGFVGGHDDDKDDVMLLEAMALLEGLHTAIRLRIARVKAIIDHRQLHNYILGLSRPTEEKLADVINQALSVRKQFEQCEISLVKQGQVDNMLKLAKEALDIDTVRYLATNEYDKRESCNICLYDVETTKIHAVEGCSHRVCVPCMKKHMETVLLQGKAPSCPQHGCTTKLSMEEGSRLLLPSRLLEMMAQRVMEENIHPSQRIYCPYPKCSALMSLSQVMLAAGSSSCSDYYDDTACSNNAETTLRKCVKCGGSICVNCKVAWHERMSCLEYQRCYPHGSPEDEMLQILARQQLWKQCERCNHMIEHTTGCQYITCMCGNYLCYFCGKTLEEDGRCACTELARRRRRGCFPLLACWRGMCR